MTLRGACALWLACAACAGKLPETRYYQLASPEVHRPAGGELLVLEPLSTDAAYDDDRIVYRTTPFRFDYYHYHRWSSAPGIMVGNYLEQALEASGRFRAVVRELTPDAPVILGGRVVAIEEVDRSRTAWIGRIVLELVLTDARSGEALWTDQLEETEPLRSQTPEGLAAALSAAMARIAARTVPVIASLTERQARRNAEHPDRTSRADRADRAGHPNDARAAPRPAGVTGTR
ncbi:MAG TPA: ABC-type transport auxiliary lipoprotein family protein [Kofleriaceae bacterium]|nr:ABC-type transport auxiliary lipoprotein family protein [Kofleriaceae bacterium]